MSFRHDPLGALVTTDPARAHAKLVSSFKRQRGLHAVARALGVAPSTVTRWISRLGAEGYTDPRIEAGVATFSLLIDSQPEAVHARLVTLFAELGQQNKVAEALGVQPSSVARWIDALREAGFKDPRPSRAA